MTTMQTGPSVVIKCDECGRQSDDPGMNEVDTEEGRTYTTPIFPGWTHIALDLFGFDICPVCINMKFTHILHQLRERQARR